MLEAFFFKASYVIEGNYISAESSLRASFVSNFSCFSLISLIFSESLNFFPSVLISKRLKILLSSRLKKISGSAISCSLSFVMLSWKPNYFRSPSTSSVGYFF
jgi:hypothetical protein